MNDFSYLDPKSTYLDAACQSLRPQPVIDAMTNYYHNHNSCGERVKYPWGEKTDQLIADARTKVLKFLKLKSKDYFVSFTLNTTYGLNLLLNELDPKYIKQIITSDIEHNSPFLSTMSLAQRLDVPRIILKRNDDGSLPLSGKLCDIAHDQTSEDNLNFKGALVVVNCAANFDGCQLSNLKDLIKKVHQDKGIIIIDAAQTMAHYHSLLEKTDADAICFSAHKMYAASLGVMVVKRDLAPKLQLTFIGGGMVDDVFSDHYLLSAENKDHTHTIFEPGLQAWAEIISLGAAIDWLSHRTKKDHQNLLAYATELDKFLRSKPKVHMIGAQPNPTMSFYVDGMDSHLLGSALGKEHIMARTGYFCAHYYLDKVRRLPPLIRFSLSYATTAEDISRIKRALKNL